GERILKKAVQLAQVYPGELAIGSSSGDFGYPFSIKLDDFRLSNIMIDEQSGKVLGLIDFEGTTTAPLWMCAGFPYWLEDDENDVDGKNREQAALRDIFSETIKAQGEIGEEWLEASEKGLLFRKFAAILDYQIQVWARPSMEKWVDERLAFAVKHPGVGMPEKTLEEEAEEWVAAMEL
ncbi:hypothetical protein BU17DRAFT_49070, partial [Hysterangium stoloniferum]